MSGTCLEYDKALILQAACVDSEPGIGLLFYKIKYGGGVFVSVNCNLWFY